MRTYGYSKYGETLGESEYDIDSIRCGHMLVVLYVLGHAAWGYTSNASVIVLALALYSLCVQMHTNVQRVVCVPMSACTHDGWTNVSEYVHGNVSLSFPLSTSSYATAPRDKVNPTE